MNLMNGRLLATLTAVVMVVGLAPAWAQSPVDQTASQYVADQGVSGTAPQTARGIPGEPVPSAEQVQRERLEQELNRREREYLAAIARMA